MKLEYQISATSDGTLRTVLRGVEREAAASNKRMQADAVRTAKTAAKQATTRAHKEPMFGPGRKDQMAAIRAQERAEITAAKNIARTKASLERQRSAEIRKNYQEEIAAAKHKEATLRSIGRGAATAGIRGVGNVLKAGGAIAGLVGGIGIAGALEEQTSITRMSSQLANMMGKPGEKGKIAGESTQVAGFTGTETLQAMSAFTEKTGDVEAARAAIQSLGQLAVATGSDFGDLGGAAGAAFNIIRDTITDPKKQIEALQNVMQGLAAQGNLGAVELKDMVVELQGLGAASRRFEGGPVGLIKTMGAMAQASVLRGGAASAAEATTAVSRFSDDIVKDRHNSFEKNGIERFTDKTHTKLRAPEEIMTDVLEKTGGDLEKVKDMFGVYAARAVGGFSPLFIDAEKQKKGSGKQKVLNEFARFRDASLSGKDLESRVASRMEDPDLQFKEAMKQFNTAVGKDLLPAVTKLIEPLSKLTPYVGDAAKALAGFAEWFAANPMTGLGALLSASILKEMAAAGIGSIIKNGFGELNVATGGAVGKLNQLAGAAALAAAAWGLAYDQNESLKKENGGLGIGDLLEGFIMRGEGFQEQVDNKMNTDAIHEKLMRESAAPVKVKPASAPAATAPMIGPKQQQDWSKDFTQPTGGAAQSSAALTGAAKELVGAAVELRKSAGNQPAPNRSAPIISRP